MRLLFFIATISILFAACKDPGSIGAGLLSDEEFMITEEFVSSVPGKTIRGDSVSVNEGTVSRSIGILNDPVFGESVNQLFLNATFNVGLDVGPPDFADATLDSIVLRFSLFEDYHYGDVDATHLVEVFQMNNLYSDEIEMLGDSISTYSAFEFDESALLGTTSFIPNYTDSIELNIHTTDTILKFLPQLRVKLDNSFGEIFFSDTTNISSDTTFMNLVKGLLVRSTPTSSSMLGLDLGLIENQSLDFYYTKSDDTKEIYPFNIGRRNHLNVIHEYEGSGSDVEAALNGTSEDQELLYVESYSGAFVEFDISGVKDYADEIINYASLELTLADIPEYDNELYDPINNFALSTYNEDGDLRVISDIQDLIDLTPTFIEESFGGDAFVNGLTGETTYTMNITSHVRELLNGEHGENYTLILSNFAKLFEPNRSIIYGNGSDGPAPKLKLVISEP